MTDEHALHLSAGDHAGHAHAHRGEHRHQHGTHAHSATMDDGNRRRTLAAAILTGGFMLAEVLGGLLTGSLALLADAGHMLTDAVALSLAYWAYRVSNRPGTSRMTYGFDRLKIVVAYTNGVTVFGIAAWIGVEAAMRLAAPQPVLGLPMLLVATAGLVVNLACFVVLHGGDRESLNLRGAIVHVLGDLLGSAAAILAAVVVLTTGWTQADPLLSLLVGLLLLRSAWALIRESGLILLEGVPDAVDRNEIAADLTAHLPSVSDVHHMHLWGLDGRQLVATLHARLRPEADAAASVVAIKSRLRAVHGIGHATVEIETGERCLDALDERDFDAKA